MRANLTLDQNNYILTLKKAIDGEYEVPDDIDLNFLNCYYLSEGKFLFDEEKYKQVKEKDGNRNEIESLQKQLNATDYILAKYCEEILALNNPLTWIADVIKVNLKYISQYSDIIKQRAEWRARIKELENEL